MHKTDSDLELWSLSHKYYKLPSLTVSGNNNLMNPDGNNMLIAFGADHCDRFATFCMNVMKQPQALIMILLPLLKPLLIDF